jgi:hypothetical protein
VTPDKQLPSDYPDHPNEVIHRVVRDGTELRRIVTAAPKLSGTSARASPAETSLCNILGICASVALACLFPFLTGALRSDSESLLTGLLAFFSSIVIVVLAFVVWPEVREDVPYLADLVTISFALAFIWEPASWFFFAISILYSAVSLVRSRVTRDTLRAAFSQKAGPNVDRTRKVVSTSMIGSGIVSTILVVLKFRDVYTIFVALVSWLILVHMAKIKLLIARQKETLRYQLTTHLWEFLAVCTGTVALCCVAGMFIAYFLPGAMTIGSIERANHSVELASAVAKRLKVSGIKAVLGLLALWALRYLMIRRGERRSAALLEKTSRGLKLWNRVAGFAYLAAITLTSFTLFNNQPGSMAVELKSKVVEIREIQLKIQSRVYWYIQDQYKRRLFDEAWRLLSPAMQMQVHQSNQLLSDEWMFYKHFLDNYYAYEVLPVDIPAYFRAFYREQRLLPTGYIEYDSQPGVNPSMTFAQLKAHDAQSDALDTERKGAAMPEYLDGMSEELSHKVFDAVLPLDDAAKHLRFLDELGTEFPVFEQMVSSIIDSTKDYAFDRIWNLAGDIASDRRQPSSSPLRASAQRLVAELLAKANPVRSPSLLLHPYPALEPLNTRMERMDEEAKHQLLVDIDAKRAAARIADRHLLSYLQYKPVDVTQYDTMPATHDILEALSKVDKDETARLVGMLQFDSSAKEQEVRKLIGDRKYEQMEESHRLQVWRNPLGTLFPSRPPGGREEPRPEPHEFIGK